MNDTHAKTLGLLALAGAIVGAVLPQVGVNPSVASEITQILASLAAIVAFYLHVSPDMPLPAAWQEIAGRIGVGLGSLLVFVPAICAMLKIDGGAAARVAQVIGAIAGVLGAYAVRSPSEKKLEIVASRPPIVLPILLLLCGGCVGLTTHAGSNSERCAALVRSESMWTMIEAIAVPASGAGGLSSIPVKTDTGKDVVLISSALVAGLGGLALYLERDAGAQYGLLCETSTKAAK